MREEDSRMTKAGSAKGDAAQAAEAARRAREAEALRENLRRRKAQARGRNGNDKTGPAGSEE